MICCENKTYRVEKMKKPKIIHVLANGQKVNSIEGHVIPGDNPVYAIIIGAQKSKGENNQCENQIV